MGQCLSSHDLPLAQRNSTGHEKDPRARQVVPTGAAGVRSTKGSWRRSHQGRLCGEQKAEAGTWDSIQMSQSGFLQSNKPSLKGGWLLQKWSPPVPSARSGKRLSSVKTGLWECAKLWLEGSPEQLFVGSWKGKWEGRPEDGLCLLS